MRITCLMGSPRTKGNTALMAQRFLTTAEEMGAEVRTHVLNNLSYRGCQACYACKTTSEVCVLDDDLSPVLEEIKEADLLVIASPVYFADVTSQVKAFIDRTFSYVKPDFQTNPQPYRLAPGKKLLFIQAQEAPEESYGDIFPRYEFFFKLGGFVETRLIRATEVGPAGAVLERPEFLKEAEAAAREMCAG